MGDWLRDCCGKLQLLWAVFGLPFKRQIITGSHVDHPACLGGVILGGHLRDGHTALWGNVSTAFSVELYVILSL
jgi:hypothetical protein